VIDGAPPIHGGDLQAVGARYGIDPATLLDFSANVNPLGPPPALCRALEAGARDLAELGRYPEPDAGSLRHALGAHLDVDPEAIVVANGAAALIGTALAAARARACVVPTPAFSEDRHAADALNVAWFGVPLRLELEFALEPPRLFDAVKRHAANVCLITNPHNPTGSLATAQMLRTLADELRSLGASTIVDEAFIDYAPAASLTRFAAEHSGPIVIRSLTKLFAVPALRVGYAVAAPSVARRMRALLPSWPVTTLAMRALAAALDDLAYVERSVRENEIAREILARDLRALGFHVTASAANFLLLTLPSGAQSAAALTRRLILAARIVVRDCSSYDGLDDGRYIRVAVRQAPENERLIHALSAALADAG
jgi:threonine-phosphate decarboxylase